MTEYPIQCVAVFDPQASNNKGKITGTVRFIQTGPDNQTLVWFKLSGFQPNTVHGCHVHEAGDLTRGCASSCSHYNPHHTLHGSITLFGSDRHAGDLCNNIVADKQGNVDFKYEDELVDLAGPFSVVGRMVVIHDKPDDLGKFRYENSPRGKESAITGNAGARIACSVIGLVGPC